MKFINKLTSWYFSRKALSYWVVLLLDCFFIVLSGILSYALYHGALYTLQNFWPLVGKLMAYLVCYLVGFRVFHTYSGVLRFSSFIDLRRIGLAVGLGLVLSIVIQQVFSLERWLVALSPAVMVTMALISIAMMWAVRIIVKGLYDDTLKSQRTEKAFIYGVAECGIAIAKSIRIQETSPYEVSGFISDQEDLQDKLLMGTKVYRNDSHLAENMLKAGASVVFVSPLKSDELRRNEEMVNSLILAGIKILMVPDAMNWDRKSDLSYTQLREVNVEDLLPRDKIEIDMEAVERLLRGKRILITGAAGSIGSEMVRQVAQFDPAELILVDQAETPLHDIRLMMARKWPNIKAYTIVADIANQQRMDDIFRQHHPEYVFHAAAYKHVPMMEDNPAESIENNVNGTRIIADLAVRYGTDKFVMVSTDKAVNPTNVMGCSKRICEIYVQDRKSVV